MKLLPDPLHPALVHFPVVLILLGALVAVAAVFWRKSHLPHLAAALLALGAVGAWVAVQTGESDGGLLETGSPPMETLLDAHEDWAKRTLAIAIVAAVAAVGSPSLFRFPRVARAAAVAAALAAGLASYAVYETGHRGGALVFRHGAGVTVGAAGSPAASGVGAPAAVVAAERRPEQTERDRD